MKKNRRKSMLCHNCQTALLQQENYCPTCGQENHSRQASLGILANDFVQDYFGFDSKLFNSLRPLLFSPGKMTKDYLAGKRQQFIAPIRLFLFLSFVYFGLVFLIANDWSEAIVVNGETSSEQDLEGFYDALARNVNWIIFAFIPMQAWLTKLFFRSKEHVYYVHFFVWTLHTFSFILVIGILKTLLVGFLPLESSGVLLIIYQVIVLSLIASIIVYCGISLKRVFAKRYSWIRFVLLSILSLSIFFLVLLFWILFLAWDHQLVDGIMI